MSNPNMEADKMLDVYIHDYLLKRKLSATARTFHAEAEVTTNRTAIDAPSGFLLEWWTVFWDIFIARFRLPISGSSGSYNAIQMIKSLEQKQQQQQNNAQSQQHHHMQIQQLLLQKQQQGNESQLTRGTGNEAVTRQSLGTANAITKRVYENRPPVQKIPQTEANRKLFIRPKSIENSSQRLDANHHALISKPVGDRPSWQVLHGTNGCNLRFSPPRDHAQQLSAPEDHNLSNMVNSIMNFKAAESGSNQGVNSLPLKGWPLTGLEQLQSGVLQLQSSPIHPSQPSQQLQQQQIQMLLNNQYMDMWQDDQSNVAGNIVSDRNLPVQAGLPLFSREDSNMIMKFYQQQVQNSITKCQQPALLGQPPENPISSIQHEDRRVSTGNTTMDVSLSNTSRGDDQNWASRKRKQPMSSGLTNSSGTANTISRSPSSAPSTPSTHTIGDVLSTPALLHDDNSSKACVNGSGVVCSSTLASTQMADITCGKNHGSVDNCVESFLSHDNATSEIAISRCQDASKDIIFMEHGTIYSDSVNCCDISCDGKLVANGGDDKKILLWCTDSREKTQILEEHSDAITDVRFSARLPRLASSSLDKTIKIWDVHSSGHSIRTFTGHSSCVLSLDFHPNKADLICSCDDVSTIRYWSIKNGGCVGVSKVGATQVRFQPTHGKYLAAAITNAVSLIDVETTQICRYPSKGHTSNIRSICWSTSGEYMTSLSEDLVKVWKISSGGELECMHELSVTGKRYLCCTFHPRYPSLLVLGSHQSLELWHMAENKMMTLLEEPVSSLAVSPSSGLVASAVDNNLIKLWK